VKSRPHLRSKDIQWAPRSPLSGNQRYIGDKCHIPAGKKVTTANDKESPVSKPVPRIAKSGFMRQLCPHPQHLPIPRAMGLVRRKA
jgi:hypothetical protein